MTNLIVLAVPSQPRDLHYTAHSNLLQWSEPETDGGAPILGYLLSYKFPASDHWLKVRQGGGDNSLCLQPRSERLFVQGGGGKWGWRFTAIRRRLHSRRWEIFSCFSKVLARSCSHVLKTNSSNFVSFLVIDVIEIKSKYKIRRNNNGFQKILNELLLFRWTSNVIVKRFRQRPRTRYKHYYTKYSLV